MSYVVGIALALAVAVLAGAGFGRDRAFYPTVLIVVASYYVLFAVMSGSSRSVAMEVGVMTAFCVIAVVGFKGSLWIVVGGLAGHGVLDLVHGSIVTNTGVPAWWPSFCMSFDVMAAGALAWLLRQRLAPVREPWPDRT